MCLFVINILNFQYIWCHIRIHIFAANIWWHIMLLCSCSFFTKDNFGGAHIRILLVGSDFHFKIKMLLITLQYSTLHNSLYMNANILSTWSIIIHQILAAHIWESCLDIYQTDVSGTLHKLYVLKRVTYTKCYLKTILFESNCFWRVEYHCQYIFPVIICDNRLVD